MEGPLNASFGCATNADEPVAVSADLRDHRPCGKNQLHEGIAMPGPRLSGKVAFITGAGGGIGRATTERFVEEGAKVVLAEIDKERGEAAAASARAMAGNAGGDAHFIHCDITDAASVTAAVAETVSRFGKLDVLHNNAGGSTPEDGPVTSAPEEEFWRVLKLDLYGTFLCSRIAIPEIAKAGGGSIINMASNLALMAVPGRACYTAAKGGVAAMTRAMALDHAKQKIRVNAIAPSVTLSDRVKKLMAGNPGVAKLGESHLFGLGQPINIANMAVYLASDEAAITTGQVFPVDSGVTIY
jgi:NAD(P)-dependent dehydrogenase (short-subunit alcohol dehydrogenase family)